MQPQPETKGGPQAAVYRGQVRYGMAVAVKDGDKTLIAGGPERIAAFAGESVRWKLINSTREPVTFELTAVRRVSGEGLGDPFESGKRTATVPPNVGAARAKDYIEVKIKRDAATTEPTTYHYEIWVEGKPNSGIDPEMDIWP
jgi:hypothetical protein